MAVRIFSAQTWDVNGIINTAVRIHLYAMEERLKVDDLMLMVPMFALFEFSGRARVSCRNSHEK
jgi:hypothetical protein